MLSKYNPGIQPQRSGYLKPEYVFLIYGQIRVPANHTAVLFRLYGFELAYFVDREREIRFNWSNRVQEYRNSERERER